MKYTHLLFDLDNTIMDFTKSSVPAFRDTLHHFEILEEQDFYPVYRKINKKVWEELERGDIDQQTLRAKRFRLFFEYIGKPELDPLEANARYLQGIIEHPVYLKDALDILEEFKDEFTMSIVTNGLKEVQRPRLENKNLKAYFKSIIVSDEIGVAKPHKEFFDYVFDTIPNAKKETTLIIGDSLGSDIRGGNNYGIDSCWMNYHKTKNATEITPTYTITRLGELRDYVR